MNQEYLDVLKREINAVVDKWVSTILKDRLISGTDEPRKTSLWDRLKQGMANWWYGPQGEQDNPYRWKNRFGSQLGVTESFDPTVFTLSEYCEIKRTVDSVEQRMDEHQGEFEKLRLTQILRAAGEDLKSMLFAALKDKVVASPPATSSAPASPEAATPAPPKAEPESKPTKNAQKTTTVTVEQPGKKQAPTKPSAAKKPSTGIAGSGASATAAAKEQGKKSEEGASTNPTTATAKEKAGDGDGQSSVDNKNEDLAGYLQDDKAGKRYDLDDAVEKITGFLLSVEAFKNNEDLKSWWGKKVEGYIEKSTGEGDDKALDQLWEELVGTDLIVDSISKTTGTPKADLKRMMIDHLAGRKTTQAPAEPKKEVGEEQDASLGLDAYFTTDGVKDDPTRAVEKIERFIRDPMKSVGSSTQPEVAEALAKWWSSAKKEIEESSDKSEFIAKNMSERPNDPEYIPPFVAQVANLMNKSPKYVANLMRNHIRKKLNRQ